MIFVLVLVVDLPERRRLSAQSYLSTQVLMCYGQTPWKYIPTIRHLHEVSLTQEKNIRFGRVGLEVVLLFFHDFHDKVAQGKSYKKKRTTLSSSSRASSIAIWINKTCIDMNIIERVVDIIHPLN